MASDYDNKRFSIELMKTGEKVGSWGDVTNVNWESISSAIGSRTELDIDDPSGSSTYVTGTGVLTLLLPINTSPDAGTWDSGSRAAYISVTNTAVATPATGIVKLRICGNVSTEKVDRFYFIKNSLGVVVGVPAVPIVLQVYNADDGTFVSVAEGSTVAVSLSSTAITKIVDITNQLQVGKLDFTGIAAGSAEIFIKDGDEDSLKVMQVKDDRTTREVYSIGTTKGVTSIALGGTTGGYGNDGTYDLGFTGGVGGSGAKGTFDVGAITPGTISNITITAEGEGYTSAPTINFNNAVGVKSISTTTSGSGYTEAATIDLIFSSGGSPTAVATGTVSTVPLTGFLGATVLTSRGAGYSSAPTVTLDPSYAGPGTGGVVTAVESAGATGTPTIAEASVLDLTGSTTKITKGVIEQATIGAATPLSGKFTTLESTGDTTIGSSATDTIDITGLIDGPITFKNDADSTTNIGSDTSRAASIVAEKITVNEAGTGEVEIDFKSGGDTGATSPGTTTELKGRVFTDGSDASVNLESSKGMATHGGIGLKIEDTTRKAYIVRGTGLTGLSSVTLTNGGSGYTPNGLDQTLDLDGTVPIPTTDAILLYDVIGGIVSNMRLSHPGSGFSGTFPSDTTDPIPTGGTGSACTYTTASVPGTTDTEIGSLHPGPVVPDPSTSLTDIGDYFTDSQPASGNTSAGENVVFDMGVRLSTPVLWRTGARCTTAESGFIAGDEIEISSKGVTYRSAPFAMIGSTWMTWLDPANSHAMMSFIGGTQGSFQTVRLTDGNMVTLIAANWDFFIHAWW